MPRAFPALGGFYGAGWGNLRARGWPAPWEVGDRPGFPVSRNAATAGEGARRSWWGEARAGVRGGAEGQVFHLLIAGLDAFARPRMWCRLTALP